jgi:hypothetical protein
MPDCEQAIADLDACVNYDADLRAQIADGDKVDAHQYAEMCRRHQAADESIGEIASTK